MLMATFVEKNLETLAASLHLKRHDSDTKTGTRGHTNSHTQRQTAAMRELQCNPINAHLLSAVAQLRLDKQNRSVQWKTIHNVLDSGGSRHFEKGTGAGRNTMSSVVIYRKFTTTYMPVIREKAAF